VKAYSFIEINYASVSAIRLVMMLFSVLMVFGCESEMEDNNVRVSFPIIDTLGSGRMTWDGDNLWVVSSYISFSRYLCCLDEEGEVIDFFPAPGGRCGAIEWDGEYFWVHDGPITYTITTPIINVYKVDREGNVLLSWQSPVPHPQDIVFDGQDLWLFNGVWSQVSINGQLIYSMNNSTFNSGACWDGNYICCVMHPSRLNPNEDRWSTIYKLNYYGSTADSIKVTGYQFWGLAFDGSDFMTIGIRRGESNGHMLYIDF
jgi:hypothetical protein